MLLHCEQLAAKKNQIDRPKRLNLTMPKSYCTPEDDAEAEKLSELKANMSDCPHPFTATAYVRFLRGRKGVVADAARAMHRHVQWRNEKGVESLDPSDFRTEFRKRTVNVDEKDITTDGMPIVRICAHLHDKNDRDVDRMEQYFIFQLERALKLTEKDEEKLIILFDLSGFTMQCMDYEILKLLVKILQYNYPETLFRAYVIDAPFMFSMCWAIIKPWLDPVTARKAEFKSVEEMNHLGIRIENTNSAEGKDYEDFDDVGNKDDGNSSERGDVKLSYRDEKSEVDY